MTKIFRNISIFLFSSIVLILLNTTARAMDITLSGGVLTLTAEVDEDNRLEILYDNKDDEYVFRESNINIAGAIDDCTGEEGLGSRTIVCVDTNINSIEIDLKDEDDKVWVEEYDHEITLNTGSGADLVTWHFDEDAGDDGILDMGSGDDELKIYGDSENERYLFSENSDMLRIAKSEPRSIRVDVDNSEKITLDTEGGDDEIIFAADLEELAESYDIELIISGGLGNDIIDASKVDSGIFRDKDVTLNGNDGNDTIKGTEGDDIINCGEGVDVYDGIAGFDEIDPSCTEDEPGLPLLDIVGHTFETYINELFDLNIVRGDNGYYSPDEFMTRGQFIHVGFKAFQMEEDTSCGDFSDVPLDHTFYKSITTFRCKGLVVGTGDNNFGVNDNVTRGQAMKILERIMNSKEIDTSVILLEPPFSDVPVTDTFASEIKFMAEAEVEGEKIIQGDNGLFLGGNNITRGQAAKVYKLSRDYWLANI